MRPYKVLGNFTVELMWVGLFKRNNVTFNFGKYSEGRVYNLLGLLVLISWRT